MKLRGLMATLIVSIVVVSAVGAGYAYTASVTQSGVAIGSDYCTIEVIDDDGNAVNSDAILSGAVVDEVDKYLVASGMSLVITDTNVSEGSMFIEISVKALGLTDLSGCELGLTVGSRTVSSTISGSTAEFEAIEIAPGDIENKLSFSITLTIPNGVQVESGTEITGDIRITATHWEVYA